MKLCLSAKGLKQAATLDKENRFTFVVGSDEAEFECARFQACFVSKKVCSLLSNDPTVEKLNILPDREVSCFGLIVRLWNGESICVDETNADELGMLSRELENDELSKLLVNFHLSNENISKENCISRLHLKQSIGMDAGDEIEFIAANFSEFEASFIRLLSVSDLEQILQHGSLKLENENAFFDIILEISRENDEYLVLCKYVHFEFMDSEHVTKFMDTIYPERIDHCIWESLTRFVISNLKGRKQSECSPKGKLFEYDSSSPLKGIFAQMRNECGGNPHSKGVIKVTSSSSFGAHCSNVLDYGWNNCWYTQYLPNSWIQFDLKDKRISLSSYTIKTWDHATQHIKYWKIEGSNDCSKWTQIDEKATEELKGPYFTKNFQCSQITDECFRYIRLTATGPTCRGNNDHILLMSEIEFFGRLIESKDC